MAASFVVASVHLPSTSRQSSNKTKPDRWTGVSLADSINVSEGHILSIVFYLLCFIHCLGCNPVSRAKNKITKQTNQYYQHEAQQEIRGFSACWKRQSRLVQSTTRVSHPKIHPRHPLPTRHPRHPKRTQLHPNSHPMAS